MVFVLDNYDSFTYNLVQYLGELGAEVVVKRNDEVTVDEIAAHEAASASSCRQGRAGPRTRA